MKALSISQPWSCVILDGHKLVENRTWRRTITGPVLVHAGKKYDSESEPFIIDVCTTMGFKNYTANELQSTPRGAILGIMHIRDCVAPLEAQAADLAQGAWAFGPWCYRLDWVKRFERPIPYKGELGFFNVPDEVVREAMRNEYATR
jgi:hypothetical protein